MPQIFSPAANTWFRVVLLTVPLQLMIGLFAIYRLNYSSYATQVGVPVDQPVAFSHQHHVAGLGLDCRYCHTSVEKSAFAGMPSSTTCMTCHSQVWTEAPILETVRRSLALSVPIRWTRVHQLADFVYFDHSIHIRKGIGCVSCHGRVDQMPITWKEHTLQMGWCTECHRHPETALRPPTEVFNLNWTPTGDQQTRTLLQQAHLRSTQELTDCTACHR
ncbi:MAG TPA: cytochrome c3 family protein [Chthoniobacterales bacterium]|nr:cytochrome c3 family protein [Chthoniobacterales bacterium]